MIQTLIIGQGMAGSVLAWQLHQRGHSVRIIDDAHATSSSRVAAGMINPVQGQRLNLPWRIEDCLPVAQRFFAEMAELFGRDFFHPIPLLRLIDNEKETDYLHQRQADERFTPYLGEFNPPNEKPTLADENGSLFIHNSGYVETNPLLDCLQQYFLEQGILCNAEFKHAELSVEADHVCWREIEATQVIFAEGWRILKNPWFIDFNFQPNKGEILTVKADVPLPEHLVNRGKWIIPLPDGTAWCGSTYGRGIADEVATSEGREAIMDKVRSILPTHQLEVVGHRAGVRCSTGDHIPRAGFHPEHPRIGVFNGFGSKGNVFIPWLAEQFVDNLCHGAAMPPECDFAKNPPRRKSK